MWRLCYAMDRPVTVETIRWLLVLPVALLAMAISDSLLRTLLAQTYDPGSRVHVSDATSSLIRNAIVPGLSTFCSVHFGRLIAPHSPYRTALVLTSFWLVVFLIILLLLASDGFARQGLSPELFSIVCMAAAVFLAWRSEPRRRRLSR